MSAQVCLMMRRDPGNDLENSEVDSERGFGSHTHWVRETAALN